MGRRTRRGGKRCENYLHRGGHAGREGGDWKEQEGERLADGRAGDREEVVVDGENAYGKAALDAAIAQRARHSRLART